MSTMLGQTIGPIGFGLMGLTWVAEPPSEEVAFAAMKASLEAGANFWNAGEFYGTSEYNSLHLLERYFAKYPEDADKVVLSIKGGITPSFQPDGSEAGVRRSVDNCLNILKGRKKLDIFECARVDPKVPLEETLKTLGTYVADGKLGGIALSEVNKDTIRKASAITKIVAVEVELSLFTTDILSNGVAAAAAECGIPIVAYSPMGRGLLSGGFKGYNDVPKGDIRLHMPRFQSGALEANLKITDALSAIAEKKKCTQAQLAIGWCLAQSKRNGNPEIIPIPGSTKAERVKQNSKVVELSSADLTEIDEIIKENSVVGHRFFAQGSELLEG